MLLSSIELNRNEVRGALRTLNVSASPPDAHERAEQAYLVGWAHVLLGEFSEAEAPLRFALQTAGPLGDEVLLEKINLNYSALLIFRNEYAEAETRLRKVIEGARRRGDRILEGQAMLSLGFNDLLDLRAEESVEWSRQAIDVLSKTKDRLNCTKATANLGWAYLSLGALDNALECFTRAAQQAGEIDDPLDEITSWNGASEILLRQRKYSQAAEASRRALELSRKAGNAPWQTDSLDALAEGALDRKQWDEAQRYNDQSRAISMRLGKKELLVNNQEMDARIAAGRKQYAAAERLFEAVLASKDSEDSAIRLEARAGLAKLYAAEGRAAQAEAQFHAAIAYSETLRGRLKVDENKVTYLSSLIGVFRDYVSFLIGHHEEAKALEVADSSRARVLSEKLIAEPKPRSARDFEALARRTHSVLLSYWLGPERSYLWAVDGSGVSLFELPDEEKLGAAVRKYQSFLEDELGDPIAARDSRGAGLWQTLIGPAKEKIPPGARVILVPDGSLHSLNFETLPVAGERWHYWIEDVTITVAPSLGLLLSGHTPRTEAPDSVLLVGAPLSPGPDFPALPHAADEVRLVRSHFATSAKVYEGAAAEPAVYREASPGRFRVIHFAAHSLPNRQSPLDSALILSPHGGAYKLYARDIAEVPLRAELVTISACKSAGAKTYSGEGQVGLAWAFLQAGAENVIAGLWNVDDTFTPAMMDSLYSGIEKGLSPAEALRDAKLKMIRSSAVSRKPYYWGPFLVFTGRGR